MAEWIITYDDESTETIEAASLEETRPIVAEIVEENGKQWVSVKLVEPAPVLRQQSPNGMWWIGSVNDEGQTEWVPESPVETPLD